MIRLSDVVWFLNEMILFITVSLKLVKLPNSYQVITNITKNNPILAHTPQPDPMV